MLRRDPYAIRVPVAALCGLLSVVGHAYTLDGHFGVTLSLDTANGSTDTYQGVTTYPMLQSSYTPSGPHVSTIDWTKDDWHGYWPATSSQGGPNQHYDIFGQWPSGSEPYDVEAIYFDDDAKFLYIDIVTSFDPPPGHYENRVLGNPLIVTGDLALEVTVPGDSTPGINGRTPAPDNFSYDYGVNINNEVRPSNPNQDATSGGSAIGNGVYKTNNSDWYVGTPTLAVNAHSELTNFDPNYSGFGGTYLGAALVDYYRYDFAGGLKETLYDTYVVEVRIPRSLLGGLDPGTQIGISWVEGCRDDANDDLAILRGGGDIDTHVPEPGSLALAGCGLGLLGVWARRRKIAQT